MTWWMWLLAGLSLMLLEMLTPGGFYLLFFGCGAAVVGLLVAAGIAGPAWTQILLFCGVSVVALLLFRRPLVEKMHRPQHDRDVDSLVGETAVPLDRIDAGSMGKVELRGTVWSAKNAGATAIESKQRCRVKRVDGLTLWVQAE